MFDWLMGNKDRKPIAPPPGYIPPGMPPQIANAAGADLEAGRIPTPEWMRGYDPSKVPGELQGSGLPGVPMQPPWTHAPNAIPGIRPPPSAGMGGPASAALPRPAPTAPTPATGAPASAPTEGIFGRGGSGDWELYQYQDDMGRTQYGTRGRGTGDQSQLASKATTPGQGLMSFLNGINAPPQAGGPPPSPSPSFSSGLQGPMPNGQSLDQATAQQPQAAAAAQGSLGGIAQQGSPMDNFIRLLGGGWG